MQHFGPNLYSLYLSILLILPAAATAQAVRPLTDRVSAPEELSSFPREAVELSGTLYFAASDPLAGRELRRWSGAGGAETVADLCPGRCSSDPRSLTVFAGRLYFLASDVGDDEQTGLYSTDGTSAGTELVSKIGPSRRSARLAATSEDLYLVAWTPATGWELWISPETATGPLLDTWLLDLWPGPEGSEPYVLTPVGDKLVFAADDGVHGRELWVSDGTASGTRMLADLGLGETLGASIFNPVLFQRQGQVFFMIAEGDGCSLYASDATTAGTRKLVDVPSGACNPNIRAEISATGDGVLLFTVGRDGELWRTDATAAGTRAVFSFSSDFRPTRLTAAGGQVFFVAGVAGSGRALWVSDGSAPGTRLVTDLFPTGHSDPQSLTPLGDRLVFTARTEELGRAVWITDGSPEGTKLVADIHPEPGSSMLAPGMNDPEVPFAPFGGRLVFPADNLAQGEELWVTDGTPAGTVLAADVNPGVSSSDPTHLVRLAGHRTFPSESLAFTVGDGLRWTDGVTVRSFTLPDDTSDFLFGSTVTAELQVGVKLFLARQSTPYHAHGHLLDSELNDLEAVQITDHYCAAMTAFQEQLFFVGYDFRFSEGYYYGLFSSRGVGAESVRVAGLPELVSQGTAVPLDYCPPMPTFQFGDRLYVQAPSMLLYSDGTARGTGVLNRSVEAVVAGDNIFSIGTVYPVTVSRSSGEPGDDEALAAFSSLGVSAPGTFTRWPSVHSLTPFAERVFFVAETEDQGEEVWVSDGTAPGTRLFVDVDPGTGSSRPRELTVVGDRLFFVADDGVHGRELWSSDGTVAGTRLVRDLNPGAASSYVQELAVVDDALVFAADDGVHGLEPWTTDGTCEGTGFLYDVSPGPSSSSPRSFTAADAEVYFNAGDEARGFELWAMDRAALAGATLDPGPCPALPACPQCLAGGRFTVEVAWKNQHDGGTEGVGVPVELSDESVLFWFFDASNVELIVKVLDGRRVNGHYWVFYGGLSDVEYWITVTDTATGAARTYHNPPGQICGQADTRAFGQ